MAKKAQAVAAVDARAYELTYLVSAGLTDSEAGKLKDSVEALLTKHQADQVKTEEWGKKKLAYKIKKAGAVHKEARFYHATFTLTPDHAVALEKDIYLQPPVIRHLIVVADLHSSAPKKEEIPQVAE